MRHVTATIGGAFAIGVLMAGSAAALEIGHDVIVTGKPGSTAGIQTNGMSGVSGIADTRLEPGYSYYAVPSSGGTVYKRVNARFSTSYGGSTRVYGSSGYRTPTYRNGSRYNSNYGGSTSIYGRGYGSGIRAGSGIGATTW